MQPSLFTEPAQQDVHAQTPKSLLDKVPVKIARQAAAPIIAAIRPVCSKIVLAGSARRERTHVGDIEFVAIERHAGAILHELYQFCYRTKKNPVSFFGKNKGEKHIQVRVPLTDRELQLEFWITTPKQFGWIHYLRTGPADWNIATVMQLKSYGYEIRDGLIIDRANVIDCSEEETVFKLLGIPSMEPKLRCTPLTLARALTDAGQQPKFPI